MTDLARLEACLASLGPVAVAVSGGVDSMTLAYVAHRVNSASRMFHALSPAVPVQATERVRRYAARERWNLEVIDAGEIRDPRYLANPANRCYFCKTDLYDTVTFHTELTVVSGTNMDDLGDYRPGLAAAKEHRVVHPYVEAGIDKDTLRYMAKSLGLDDLCELPAAPCLSSRVTTGITIDPKLLPVINEVEQALWESLRHRIAIEGVRCRIRPSSVAIQIETEEDIRHDAEWAVETRAIVKDLLERHGYAAYARHVTVEPYERGSAFLIDTLEVN